MIKKEFYMTRSDGVRLVRTYSDANMHIMRDGVMYSEAIDPEELNRQYTETDVPIEIMEEEIEEIEEVLDEEIKIMA